MVLATLAEQQGHCAGQQLCSGKAILSRSCPRQNCSHRHCETGSVDYVEIPTKGCAGSFDREPRAQALSCSSSVPLSALSAARTRMGLTSTPCAHHLTCRFVGRRYFHVAPATFPAAAPLPPPPRRNARIATRAEVQNLNYCSLAITRDARSLGAYCVYIHNVRDVWVENRQEGRLMYHV